MWRELSLSLQRRSMWCISAPSWQLHANKDGKKDASATEIPIGDEKYHTREAKMKNKGLVSAAAILVVAAIAFVVITSLSQSTPVRSAETPPQTEEYPLMPGQVVPVPIRGCPDKTGPTFEWTGNAQRNTSLGTQIGVSSQIEIVVNGTQTTWVQDGGEIILPYCNNANLAIGVIHTHIPVVGPWGNPGINLYEYGVER